MQKSQRVSSNHSKDEQSRYLGVAAAISWVEYNEGTLMDLTQTLAATDHFVGEPFSPGRSIKYSTYVVGSCASRGAQREACRPEKK